MNENKKGYWIYSIAAIIAGFALFGFLCYLIYDLIIKLSEKDFSNNTVVQAFISLIVTVFLGGYFSKYLERRNTKRLEIFKIQRDIALKIIDYSSILYNHPDSIEARELLIAESIKVKLFFDDETLAVVNRFIENLDDNENRKISYTELSDQLKKVIK